MAESFFAALKNERVHRTQYPTREHARRDIVRYIEFWYNSRRRHSGLQYRTPKEVREAYLERQPQRELAANTLSGKLGVKAPAVGGGVGDMARAARRRRRWEGCAAHPASAESAVGSGRAD